MKGAVRKRHFVMVARCFGWGAAVRLIISRRPVALDVLMGRK